MVAHDDQHLIPVSIQCDGGGSRGLGVLVGVGEEVFDHHAQGLVVSLSPNAPGDLQSQAQSPGAQALIHGLRHAADPRSKFQGLPAQVHAPGFGAGHIQQVVHQLSKPSQILVHAVTDLAPLILGQLPVEEGLHPHPERGDGGLQFMGHGGGEVPLAELEVHLLRELAVDKGEAPENGGGEKDGLARSPPEGEVTVPLHEAEGLRPQGEVGIQVIHQMGIIGGHWGRNHSHLGVPCLNGGLALREAGQLGGEGALDDDAPASRAGHHILLVVKGQDGEGVHLPRLGPGGLERLDLGFGQPAGFTDLNGKPPPHLQKQESGHRQVNEALTGSPLEPGGWGHRQGTSVA